MKEQIEMRYKNTNLKSIDGVEGGKALPSMKCSRSEDRLRADGDRRATTVFLQKHRVE